MRLVRFAFITTLVLVPLTARAQERAGDAALGAVSGAIVFGPVGLVAGALVGFTAGPSISRSWRDNRHYPRRAARTKQPTRVAAKTRGRASPVAPREAGSVTPAPGTGGPPAQGLE